MAAKAQIHDLYDSVLILDFGSQVSLALDRFFSDPSLNVDSVRGDGSTPT
jgi:hypothetical protein